jgi:hypothetical protein
MTAPTTHTLDVPGARLAYDVREPETPSDRRPLFIFGSPMGASGFEQLVGHFTDRTIITYDPRGMERSIREPGRELTARCTRTTTASSRPPGSGRWTRFVERRRHVRPALGRPPRGRAHLRLHEPPVITLLEDSQMAIKVHADIVATYQREGFGPAMAKFIQLVMHRACCPTTTWTGPRQTQRSSVSPRWTTAPAMTSC